MLTNAPAPPLLVLLELGLAQLDEVFYLLAVKILVSDEGIPASVLLDDAVVPEDAPYHVVGNLLVVLDLALVVGEDGALDLRGRAPAATCKERSQHNGLIHVGHLHAVLDKVQELIVGHLSTVQREPARCLRRP